MKARLSERVRRLGWFVRHSVAGVDVRWAELIPRGFGVAYVHETRHEARAFLYGWHFIVMAVRRAYVAGLVAAKPSVVSEAYDRGRNDGVAEAHRMLWKHVERMVHEEVARRGQP